MKYLFFNTIAILAAFAGVQAASSQSSLSSFSIPRASQTALRLRTTSFEFPGAGERNNNRAIGDFCCTGETAEVHASQGATVGYIYFHDFDGGITNGSRSAAIRFGVLVSGLSDAAQPKSVRVKSSIEFASSELRQGLRRRTIAGALQFTATILDVQFVDKAHSRYWMDSIKVKVDVEEAPAASGVQPRPGSLPTEF